MEKLTSKDLNGKQASDPTSRSFEETLHELEMIIAQMSGSDQTLEKSISEFERGVQLARQCQAMLKEAEQRVELLTKSSEGHTETQPFNTE